MWLRPQLSHGLLHQQHGPQRPHPRHLEANVAFSRRLVGTRGPTTAEEDACAAGFYELLIMPLGKLLARTELIADCLVNLDVTGSFCPES